MKERRDSHPHDSMGESRARRNESPPGAERDRGPDSGPAGTLLCWSAVSGDLDPGF